VSKEEGGTEGGLKAPTPPSKTCAKEAPVMGGEGGRRGGVRTPQRLVQKIRAIARLGGPEGGGMTKEDQWFGGCNHMLYVKPRCC
jgi:hypothetical protein